MTSPNARACVWPSLGYRNAPYMIEWLVQAFGLTKDLIVAGADGEIAHSELGWRGAVINVVSYTDGEDTLTTVPGKAGLYLVVDDPDAHHDRARAAGATIVRPLTDHDYGSRGYTARDPEGNAWSFGTYAGVHATGSVRSRQLAS